MITPLSNTPSSGTQSSSSSTSSSSELSGLNSMATEQTFLQLLVAQLKNQDPSQPQDGTQFVSELAQFSSVEQELQMTQDLNSINSILTADANSASQSQGASSGNGQNNGTPATS